MIFFCAHNPPLSIDAPVIWLIKRMSVFFLNYGFFNDECIMNDEDEDMKKRMSFKKKILSFIMMNV